MRLSVSDSDFDNKVFAKKKNFYKKYSRVPVWHRKRSVNKRFDNSNASFNRFSNGSNSKTSPSQRILCPDAPRNTTSFLIDDLEERNCRDVTPPTPSVSPTTRARCCSTSVATTPSEECPIAKLLPRDDDNERCDEFYDMVDTLSWERIDGLSRDEINRQLIHIEEHNRDLMFHFTKLRQENDNLRQLLKANGIDLPQASN